MSTLISLTERLVKQISKIEKLGNIFLVLYSTPRENFWGQGLKFNLRGPKVAGKMLSNGWTTRKIFNFKQS